MCGFFSFYCVSRKRESKGPTFVALLCFGTSQTPSAKHKAREEGRRKMAATKKWRFEAYGPLSWIATFVRLVAGVVALATFSQVGTGGQWPASFIFQLLIDVVLLILNIVLIVPRVLEKEIHELAVQIYSAVIGAVFLLAVLLGRYPDTSSFIFVFASLMVLSDCIRLMFLLIVEKYSMFKFNKIHVLILTAIEAALYFFIVLLQVYHYVFN